MVEFPVNPNRFDPYKNFKFRLKWDGVYVAGVSKVSALKRTTEVIEFHSIETAAAMKSPGRTEYDAITLERGLTQDRAFEDWANKTWRLGAALGSEVALTDFREDVLLEFYNEAGQRARLQDLSLLAVGSADAARARCQRQCRGDPDHEAGE